MALDTAIKRRVWCLPIPNGAISEPDRRLLGIGYAGLAFFEGLFRDLVEVTLYITRSFNIGLER